MENRRRRFFVRGGDHWGLLVGIVVLILVLILIASGLLYILASRNLGQAVDQAHFDAMRSTMHQLLRWLILVNVIGFFVVVVLAVFFTHRISGPAYHLVKDLEKLKEGDLTVRTSLRKHDHMKDVAQALSDATSNLQTDVADIKNRLSELSRVAGNYPAIKEMVREIDRLLEKLKT